MIYDVSPELVRTYTAFTPEGHATDRNREALMEWRLSGNSDRRTRGRIALRAMLTAAFAIRRRPVTA